MKIFYTTLFLFVSVLFCQAQISSEDALALQYYQKGEFDKALNIYQKLFNQSKNKAQYYDSYLNTLIKLKQYNEAEKLVKKMMNTNKGNFNYQVDFGRILQERGQQEKATEWYNGLIKNLPKEEYAIRDLSVTFYRAEAYDFSIKNIIKWSEGTERWKCFCIRSACALSLSKKQDHACGRICKSVK